MSLLRTDSHPRLQEMGAAVWGGIAGWFALVVWGGIVVWCGRVG